MTDKAKPTTAQKAKILAASSKTTSRQSKIDAEKRLKLMEDAIEKLIKKYAELDSAYTQHICTPDAHNPGMLGRNKK